VVEDGARAGVDEQPGGAVREEVDVAGIVEAVEVLAQWGQSVAHGRPRVKVGG